MQTADGVERGGCRGGEGRVGGRRREAKAREAGPVQVGADLLLRAALERQVHRPEATERARFQPAVQHGHQQPLECLALYETRPPRAERLDLETMLAVQ